MKRKKSWLLALAVPLIGLALVWRSGQRARDEADVYEAALRDITPGELGELPRVFVAIRGQDPPMTLLDRFRGSTPPILAASQHTLNPSLIEENLVGSTTIRASQAVVIDIGGIQWKGDDEACLRAKATGSSPYPNYYFKLKRQDGVWRVAVVGMDIDITAL